MQTDDNSFAAMNDGASALRDVLDDLDQRSRSFGAALTGALRQAAGGAKSLEDVLQGLGNRLVDIALSAGMKPLEGLLTNAVSGLTGSFGSAFKFADGGVPGRVTPFASGGVVSEPTYFSFGGNLGLMGEAGTEAILPLKRGPDGSLGVAASGGGGAPQIVFNVTTADAASFRKTEGQIAAMLARTVRRGQRNL